MVEKRIVKWIVIIYKIKRNEVTSSKKSPISILIGISGG